MKTSRATITPQSRRGLATFIFIALLAIMVILGVAGSRALYQLHRETRWLEQRQTQRLNASQTNRVAAPPPVEPPTSK